METLKPVRRLRISSPLVVSVIGFVAMDLILVMNRMPDAGETLAAREFKESPGGKGNNTAVATFRAGHYRVEDDDGTVDFISAFDDVTIEVRMIGVVGADKYGDDLLENLEVNGVNTRGVRVLQDYPTGLCIIMVEARSGENRVMTTPGGTVTMVPTDYEIAEDLGKGVIPDLVISQMELSRETVEHILEVAGRSGVDVLLNADPARQILTDLYKYITHLVLNETSAAILAGREVHEINSEREWDEVATEFLNLGVKNFVLTLGGRGAFYANGNTRGHVPAEVVKVRDTTGAGDTFVGAYATDYLRQKTKGQWDLKAAVVRANRAGACNVVRMGAQSSMPWANEIDDVHAALVADTGARLQVDNPVRKRKEKERGKSRAGANVNVPRRPLSGRSGFNGAEPPIKFDQV